LARFEMSFACVYIPEFVLQSALRAEPELRKCATGILDGNPPFVVVIAANPQARALGLAAGMTKVQALEIPGVTYRQRATAHEDAAHQALLDLALAFSPRIEDSGADLVTLDLQGLLPIFGSFGNLARGVWEQAAKFGLGVNVAVGSNPDAAQLAARGFEGVTVLEAAEESARLAELPVKALNAPAEILETLEYWGIRTCEALARLPREELSERLGQPGMLLQELAKGTRRRALIPTQAKLEFEETIELDTAVGELEPLAFVFSRMLGQLCERLAARALAPIAIGLKMWLEPGEEQIFEIAPEMRKRTAKATLKPMLNSKRGGAETTERQDLLVYEHTLRLPLPMRDSKALLRLWRLHLEVHPPASPVVKIQMRAEPAAPRVVQAGLFTPVAPDPEKLEITMARTAHLVGKENIGAAELPDTHRPLEFSMARFNAMQMEAGKRATKSSIANVGVNLTERKKGKTRRDSRQRAPVAPAQKKRTLPAAILRVFHPALPAQVELRREKIEEKELDAPVRVCFSGAWGEVRAASGPWRSSGEWWTSGPWDQDEWDLEIEFAPAEVMEARGEKSNQAMRAVYRITRQRPNDAWFVQGVYD
jgi:protein ImuB